MVNEEEFKQEFGEPDGEELNSYAHKDGYIIQHNTFGSIYRSSFYPLRCNTKDCGKIFGFSNSRGGGNWICPECFKKSRQNYLDNKIVVREVKCNDD